jgi:hypothetical protein
MLTNLAHPKLDAREAMLVPFARETGRYQPAGDNPSAHARGHQGDDARGQVTTRTRRVLRR